MINLPPNPLLPKLSLPQDDGDREGRERALATARDAYRYTYAKPNIRGLAMCASIPEGDESRQPYRAMLAALTGRLALNAAELEKPGHDEIAALTTAVMSEGIDAALKLVGSGMVEGKSDGPVSRFGAYAEVFREFRLPVEATEAFLDSTFARTRLAGPNPAWIRQIDRLPDDFGVDESHYRAAIGEGDSLSAALSEGRAFLLEYRELTSLQPGSWPVPPEIQVDYAKDPKGWDAAYKTREADYAAHPPKLLVAPLSLFAVRKDTRALAPVAIQLFPNGHGGEKYPVFTPRDGYDWLAAKACVNAADGTVHETIAHLGLTHLVQEAFCLAMHNCLSARHPLHRLLLPHFEGTLSINTSADKTLVNPAGFVDKLLLPTIGGCIQLAGKAVQGLDFNASMFPKQLAARGVDGDQLSAYPYRDDGRLVWGAIESWVRSYVEHCYASNDAVAADSELQAFVRQVGQYQATDAAGHSVGGGIKGVGEDGGRISTRGYLVQMITQIIWNGSAQHAAVNFPQAGPMVYAGAFPLTLMKTMRAGKRSEEGDYLAMLPSQRPTRIQLFILELLGGVHHTKLGHYPDGPLGASHFGPGALAALEKTYRQNLAGIESTIQDRNRTRSEYPYLLPSQIPQSINI